MSGIGQYASRGVVQNIWLKEEIWPMKPSFDRAVAKSMHGSDHLTKLIRLQMSRADSSMCREIGTDYLILFRYYREHLQPLLKPRIAMKSVRTPG